MTASDLSAADDIVGLYERHAPAWVRLRGRSLHLERAWIDRFTRDLSPGASVLDLGAGSGHPIAADLLRRGFKVTGVDGAKTLIKAASTTLPEAEWVVADMRSYDPGRRFEGVIAWHSFFHLRPADQEAMFLRFAALIAEGGRLMFTAGPQRGVELGEWEGEPLYHASLDADEYARLLHLHGFDLVEHCSGDPDCGDAFVWLAVHRAR